MKVKCEICKKSFDCRNVNHMELPVYDYAIKNAGRNSVATRIIVNKSHNVCNACQGTIIGFIEVLKEEDTNE